MCVYSHFREVLLSWDEGCWKGGRNESFLLALSTPLISGFNFRQLNYIAFFWSPACWWQSGSIVTQTELRFFRDRPLVLIRASLLARQGQHSARIFLTNNLFLFMQLFNVYNKFLRMYLSKPFLWRFLEWLCLRNIYPAKKF